MNKRIATLFIASLIFMLYTSPVLHAAPAELPATGQTAAYYAGDDGSLQTGVAWPNPRFTVASSGTGTVVTDNLTGLIWPQNGGTPTVGSCSNRIRTWQDALAYVACLNGANYLNHNDWRLPNISELKSLVHPGQSNTAAWLNTQGFTNAQANEYWSSTTDAGVAGHAWHVSLNAGSLTTAIYKTNNFNVWPVRAGQPGAAAISLPKTGQTATYAAGDDGSIQSGVAALEPRFTNADNTSPVSGNVAVDQLTGLMWTQNSAPNGLVTWQAALDYIAGLNASTYLGYNDWRLPNRDELSSLVNYGQSNTAAWLNMQGFANAQANVYWSSTTYAGNTSDAWLVNMMTNGSVGYGIKTLSYYVWPVRAGQSGSSISLTISKSGTGTGGVTIDRGSLIWSGSTGTASYGTAMAVNVTAVPDSGMNFVGWSGACSGTGACQVTMDAAKNITATFAAPDITPPNAPVVTGPLSPTNNARPTWTWTTGGGNGNGTFRRMIDIGSWVTTTALSYRPGSGLSNGSHTLSVQEYDDAGNWSASGESIIEINSTLAAPGAPADLDVTLDVGVTFTWPASSGDVTGYRVYRRKSIEIPWTQIGERGSSTRSYTDSAVASNTTYYYRVAAYNGSGARYSKTIMVTTVAIAQPKGLATSNGGTGTSLTWQDASLAESGYEVWRRKSGEVSFTRAATLGANTVSWLDTGVAPGAIVSYQVCAVTAEGGTACASSSGISEPTDFTATYSVGTGVSLAWTDNSTEEIGYRIYRRTAGETAMTKIAAVGADGSGYEDSTVAAGIVYYYKVCAYTSGVNDCGATVLVVVP